MTLTAPELVEPATELDDVDHIVCCVDRTRTFCGAHDEAPLDDSPWTVDEISCPLCRLVEDEAAAIEEHTGCPSWCPLLRRPCPPPAEGDE